MLEVSWELQVISSRVMIKLCSTLNLFWLYHDKVKIKDCFGVLRTCKIYNAAQMKNTLAAQLWRHAIISNSYTND